MDSIDDATRAKLHESLETYRAIMNPPIPRFPTPEEESLREVREWRAELAERAERAERSAGDADRRAATANTLAAVSLAVAVLSLLVSVVMGARSLIR